MLSSVDSEIPLVLIHGFLETRKIWLEFAENLSAEKIIIPNLPGVGDEKLPINLTIEKVADIVAATLAKEGHDRVNIIGHSLGGYVALDIAHRHPNLISKLGLFHSTAFADSEEKKAVRTKVIEFLGKNGLESFINTFVEPLFHIPNRKRLQSKISKIIADSKTTPIETAIAYTRAMRDRPDSSSVLHQFDPNVAFIGGVYDTAVTNNNSTAQTKDLHSPYILMLKNSRHMGMFEEPEKCADLINRFLSKV